jgi:hypothetical protein
LSLDDCTNGKCEAVIKHEISIKDLIRWQKSQNGAIHDANSKIDRLILGIIGILATSILSLLGTIVLLLKK